MYTWEIAAALLGVWAIAGFAFARGAEVRACGVQRSPSWCAIVTSALVGIAALCLRGSPASATACGLACIGLVVAADADVRTGYLFDAVTFPAALLVTIAVIISGSTFEAVCGVALLVGGFGAVVLLSRSRLMGLGDVKAMFALGAAFGPLESLLAIFAAAVSGIVVATFAGRLRRGTRVPFGPHLAAGSAFALVAGDHIVHHWMGL